MAKKTRHATIYDVAALAGVSIGTVSRALNAPARVAEGTRARVLDAVKELDFVPKEVATSRARRGTRRIGVFAPFSSYPSFGERLNGVLGVAGEGGPEVVVFDVESAEKSAVVLEALPALRSLDGLIVMSVPFGDRVFTAMQRARLPVVLVDLVGHGLPSVMADDEMGGQIAANTLLERGASRLAFIGHRQLQPQLELSAGRRRRGFADAAAAAGVPLRDADVILVGGDFEEAHRASVDLLAAEDRPDGVFAHTDEHAAAVYMAAEQLGLRVPDDVAVIGYDDSLIARALGLTSVRQPLRETGEWAASALLKAIAAPGSMVPSLTLPVTLTRRRSA